MAAVIEAAKTSAHVFPLAALPLFAENSPRGHHAATSTLRPGATIAISSTATGMPGCLYDSGAWSCCSSKERDAETGLDFFESRYYSSAQGRFTSPDEFKGGFLDAFTGQAAFQAGPLPYADIGDPQTLNKYAYVRNNPLRYTDPNGHCVEDLCIGEAIAVAAAFKATASAIAYLQTPQGQDSARAAIVGTGLLINKAADAIGSLFFSKSDSTAGTPKDVYIDPTKYPAAAGHAEDAQAAGQPDVLTVKRPGASDRRGEATAGHPTQAGSDRDEYPPAVTAEGGKGASVRNIPSSDNRGAGASVGNQIRDVPNGGTIRIIPKPKPPEND